MSNSNNIGNRIELLRKAKNETQADLAKALRVKRETVNQWENETRDLKTQYTVSLAEHFGTTCDYILRGIKAENISIHERTGLSDESIEALNICKNDAEFKHLHEIVNFLLEKGTPLLRIIHEYLLEKPSITGFEGTTIDNPTTQTYYFTHGHLIFGSGKRAFSNEDLCSVLLIEIQGLLKEMKEGVSNG